MPWQTGLRRLCSELQVTAVIILLSIEGAKKKKKEGENEIDATRQNFRFTFFLWCIILYIAAISFGFRIQYINI